MLGKDEKWEDFMLYNIFSVIFSLMIPRNAMRVWQRGAVCRHTKKEEVGTTDVVSYLLCGVGVDGFEPPTLCL